MQFVRLDENNIEQIKDYLAQTKISFCDISLGVKFMWRNEYKIDFAIIDDTLIMKETSNDYKDVFYYPIGANEENALNLIENYCRENFLDLEFCCIDDDYAQKLKARYFDVAVYHDRDWDDYIYTAEQFKTYSGKKLSGQRNHVNKFKKLYPDYKFKIVKKEDILAIEQFLEEYKTNPNITQGALEEAEMAKEYLENVFTLNQLAGVITVDNKIVALSIGEVVGDTLIVHVEKGLIGYAGVYPVMASEFAKAFAGDSVKFINREEDCGDMGLRTSKTQYHPIEIKGKNAVKINTLFYKLPKSLDLKTERLTITEIREQDKELYAKLYLDGELNKWWGYDYREDLDGEQPTPDYFYNFQQKMKDKKEEYSFAVRIDGVMIGELVLHNFGYYGDLEMGFRFFKDCQGKGYATISATALKEYAFNNLGAITLKSRCFKQNDPSHKLIERLGLKRYRQDDTHYYFKLEKKL